MTCVNIYYLTTVEDEKRELAYGETSEHKNMSIVMYSSEQLEVTTIGVNECPRQSPSKSTTKATTNDVARATSSKAQ